MSFEIFPEAMLAVRLSDFVENLTSGVSVALFEQGTLVVLDDLFAVAAEQHYPEAGKSSNISGGHNADPSWWCSHYSGWRFAEIVARAAGIVGADYYKNNLLNSLQPEVIFFPAAIAGIEIDGTIENRRLALVKGDRYRSVLVNLVSTLGSMGCLTVLSPSSTYCDENDEKFFPIVLPCIKLALSRLIDEGDNALKAARRSFHAREELQFLDGWAETLINAYLEQNGTDSRIEMLSNNTRTIVDLGEMEDNERYICFGLDDERGWDDPREENPKELSKLRRILFGRCKKKFEQYTFQTGG